MRQIFSLVLLSALTVAKSDDAAFIQFIAKHNKNYSNQIEMNRRKSNWKKSKWEVAELNSIGGTATYAVNFSGDMDDNEYRKILGLAADAANRNLEESPMLDDEADRRQLQTTSPDIDWSVQGRGNAPAVKDQGMCGACWAFTATSVLESAISIRKTGTGVLVPPVRLSEQQLVDCNTTNSGCTGGLNERAW